MWNFVIHKTTRLLLLLFLGPDRFSKRPLIKGTGSLVYLEVFRTIALHDQKY